MCHRILKSRNFNVSKSTNFVKQLYLGIKRKEQVFSDLFSLTFCSLVFTINIKGTSRAEKAMAPHSSTLAWRIPWTEEPGGLQSMGS